MINNNLTWNSSIPTMEHSRSTFDIPDRKKTTFNLGELHVLECREVVAGSTFAVEESKVVRTQPLVAPILDDLVLDTYHFFIPKRILWEHYENFVGASSGKWYDSGTTYIYPKINSDSGFEIGSIADDFGLPLGIAGLKVNALPFRAYASVVNHFFRNTVTEDEIYVPKDDAEQTYVTKANYDYVNGPANGGCYIANRMPNDKFNLAVVTPQRGPEVEISIGSMSGNVYGNGYALGISDGSKVVGAYKYDTYGKTIADGSESDLGSSVGTTHTGNRVLTDYAVLGIPTKTQLGEHPEYSGLVADIAGSGVVTINELRNAFAIQRYFESLAVYGNKYKDIIRTLYGSEINDARLQEPEFLGQVRVPIQINTSVQSSSTDATSPQGNVAGYSVTADDGFVFEKTFVEPGYYMVVGVARIAKHTYAQGIPKMFLKSTFEDDYNVLFQNLGFDSIKNAEIFAQGPAAINPDTGNAYDDEVFGYNERFIDLKTGNSMVTGEMRPGITGSLSMWHLADYYTQLPTLTEDWQKEDKSILDRCLAVTSANSNQFFGDFLWNIKCTAPMSLHDLPGKLIG